MTGTPEGEYSIRISTGRHAGASIALVPGNYVLGAGQWLDQKQENRKVSRRRIVVEHSIGKIFPRIAETGTTQQVLDLLVQSA